MKSTFSTNFPKCAILSCLPLMFHIVAGSQEFITQPESKVAVQGLSVIFQCKVKNRSGQVQWTRDKFGLGNDRNLPGWPRYSMIGGRSNIGRDIIEEYSLKIEDIRLEDDAEYRCQVTPTDEDPTILLSNKVNLTVKVPPQSPIIDGGQIIPLELGRPTNITCSATGGKPAPTVSWYMDGQRIANNVVTRTTKQTDKTEDVVTSVTMVAREEDARKTIECRAINDALRQPLMTSAILDVQYKPKVEMSLNISRQLQEYDYLRVSCKGNANPENIQWKWYKDGVVIPGETKKHLDLPRLSPDYNKKVIKCEASNSVGKASAQIKLSVLYRAYMPGMDLYSYIPVDIGERNVRLECLAEGNPEPSIIWRKKGSYEALSTNPVYIVPYVAPSSVGKYVCTASSLNTGFPDVSAEVNLLLKGPPEILNDAKQYATPDDIVTIKCVARIVPKGTIEWYRGNQKLANAKSGRYTNTNTRMEGGLLKNELHISGFQDSDFGDYNCTVTNSRGNDTMVITLLEKEVLPIAYIIGGVCGGVACLLFIAGSCIIYHRMRHSDNDSYAETDSNTEIRKRDKTESPLDFGKSTLMDQWRQDLNYHCPTDYEDIYNKDPRLNTSGYGTLKSDIIINAYENHNGNHSGPLFSDYTHRGDETFPIEHMNGYTNGTYGTSSFRSASRTDFTKPDYSDPYANRLPPANVSTTQLATNV